MVFFLIGGGNLQREFREIVNIDVGLLSIVDSHCANFPYYYVRVCLLFNHGFFNNSKGRTLALFMGAY